MKREKDAFPTIRIEQSGNPVYDRPSSVYYSGMSLRDYFAAQALMGLIVNDRTVSIECKISVRAYELADAMMKRRAGETGRAIET
jgi:hypothetical protein